jgi:hypothetical protein
MYHCHHVVIQILRININIKKNVFIFRHALSSREASDADPRGKKWILLKVSMLSIDP